MNSYNETLDYLYSQLPMFQRTGPAAYKNTLGNTLILDELYEHPHQKFKSIHVAGTNGKGSSSHMLASVLQEAGYKTGLYTSPHLLDFRERIRVNGQMIPEEKVVSFVRKFKTFNEKQLIEPSFFEITVAMAFDHFRNEQVDIAIIEVGLGGRLDSTNIIQPELSLITNISLDHTNLLGDTIEQIAGEKAGIIKSAVPVVISESNSDYNQVFINKAKEMKSELFFADEEYVSAYSMFLPEGKQIFNFNKNNELSFPNLKIDLLGNYQRKNIGGVLKTIELLNKQSFNIDSKSIYEGLEKVSQNTGIRGRWEIVGNNPLVVCDTAHNVSGLKHVVDQINASPWKSLHIILGMVNDKNIDGVLSILPKNAHYYFTQAKISRALPADELAVLSAKHELSGETINTVQQAFKKAKENASAHDLIFIGGSTFIVADYFS